MFVYDCISFFFFFKQKTAYELRISDWSSDVCSSDLMLKLHDFCNRAGARILWCTPVFGRAVGTQHIDEILAVWYPTHKTFLDLSDAPGAKESYRLKIGRASWRERVCQYV